MSLSVKTQGGVGGFYASIYITGLSETDIVTATNGSKTKVGVWNATESRFEFTKIKDLGTWTVTATNGEDTATQDVPVDAVEDYEIAMSYSVNYTMLYDYGDECENVTGGWSWAMHLNSATPAVTKGDDSITLAWNSGTVMGAMLPNTAIIVDEYSLLGSLVNYATPLSYAASFSLYGCRDRSLPASNMDPRLIVAEHSTSKKMMCFDFTEATGNRYCGWYINAGSSDVRLTFNSVFLAKSDDYQTLCSKAGLTAPSDLATLIADSTSIASILSNETAVRYMVGRCTGDFMVSFVASPACLAALASSPYESTIRANRHWAKFLAMVE